MKVKSGLTSSASFLTSVPAPSRSIRTIGDVLGLACLIASLLLMSTGVRTVKADGEALMSVDPQRVEAERAKALVKTPPANPAPNARVQKPQAPSTYAGPGVPAIEVEPGVVVLNTRGFNYGPPPAAIDPAAMGVEKDLQPSR